MPEFESHLKVICLESSAFNALVGEVTAQIRKEFFGSVNPWITQEEAMELLRITADGTFYKYRDEGKFIYSKLSTKQILYLRQSVLDFIENNIAT